MKIGKSRYQADTYLLIHSQNRTDVSFEDPYFCWPRAFVYQEEAGARFSNSFPTRADTPNVMRGLLLLLYVFNSGYFIKQLFY